MRGIAASLNVLLASDLVGATKMDRPEDIDVNPTTGKVYLMLTNGSRRNASQVDAEADMPPRPSVVAITKRGGGKIAV